MRLLVGLLGLCLVLAGCVSGAEGGDADAIRAVVQEYFELRADAFVTKDSARLYERFPDLATGANPGLGINAEAHWIELNRAMLFTGVATMEIEHYEPLKISVTGDRATVVARGLELYAFDNKNGSAGESGQGFNMTLDLQRRGGAWTITKTDEVTVGEAKGHK